MTRSRIYLLAAAALIAVIAALFASGGLKLPSRDKLIGVAAIGGPFTLTSHEGKPFDSKQLAGKPFAIFFGFTQCPDVCPTTLLEVSQHLKALGRMPTS
ncbi:MAG: SCO family protein [Hyphomicrobiaceae bacterium]